MNNKYNGVRFLHYRAHYPDGELSHMGGSTVGFKYDESTGMLTAAAAACSVKDRYNKSIGRQVVIGRLEGRPEYCETREMTPEQYIAEMDAEMAQYDFKRLRVV